MKKNIKLLIISGVFVFLIIGISIYIINKETKNNPSKNENELINEKIILDEENDFTEEEEDLASRVEKMKKKVALKGLISKGDYYFDNRDYTIALSTYLNIYKNIPNDEDVIKKIGDIYYNLNKFNQAYKYYLKIKNSDSLDNKKAIESLIFSKTKDLSDDNITMIKKQINSFNLTQEEVFYYTNSMNCITDFSKCKLNFQNYFVESIFDGTGILDGNNETNIKEISFDKLINIKNALDNYENFKLDDLSYKNALISGAFFSNGLYPIAIEISKKILDEKPDYKPLIKIIAKSYFELGLYKEAKGYLINYNKIDDSDPEISYFLGIIYEKLHDYILSSIHLKNSIEQGYKNSIDSRRRIIYNYYEVGENEKMLKAFEEMTIEEEKNITMDDMSLSIYYHIINNKLEKAKEQTKLALNRYEKKELFYGYLGWIQINENISGSLELAEKNLNFGLEINENNPMINYIEGLLYLKKGDSKKAFIYFKKTIFLDKNGEFAKLSQVELDKLKIKD